MKKILTLTAFALLLGVGCTAQQRQIVSNALADDSASAPTSTMTFIDYAPTDTVAIADPPVPVAPIAVAVAQCDSVNFRILGYDIGTKIAVSIGSEPPYGFTVGEPNALFNGVSGKAPVSAYWQAAGFNWDATIILLNGREKSIGSGSLASCV